MCVCVCACVCNALSVSFKHHPNFKFISHI